jgi:hypothetical protein
MRLTWTIVGFVLSAGLVVTPTYANPHSAAPPTHSKPGVTSAPPVAGNPVTPKSSTTPTTVKPTTPAGSTAKHPGASSTTSAPHTSTTTTTHVNPIAAKISSKPQLASRLAPMLPPGMTLNQASRGFKNQGQFIAALHVSQNLGIQFKDLRHDMTVRHLSLGQSIQDLKHSANAPTETHRAERQTDDDVRSTVKPVKKGSHTESEHRSSIAQRITSNTPLNAKVQALLPSGMTVTQAASGFRSENQFLAALHASKDLGIPFAQIKSEMTAGDHDSLLRAIQELKPTTDAAVAAKTAQNEATTDIRTTTVHVDHDGDDR